MFVTRKEKSKQMMLIAEVRAVRPQFPAQQLLSTIDHTLSAINADCETVNL